MSTSRVYSLANLANLEVEPVSDAFQLKVDQSPPVGVSQKGINEACSVAPPLSLYGSTKLASEIMALEYCEAFDFPVWINRCGVLGGADQFGKADQGIFSYWINAWRRHRPLTYFGFGGRGYQVRDYFHPRDLIPLLQKQTDAPDSLPRTVNLRGGADNAISLVQLSAWCAERFGPHAVASDLKQGASMFRGWSWTAAWLNAFGIGGRRHISLQSLKKLPVMPSRTRTGWRSLKVDA